MKKILLLLSILTFFLLAKPSFAQVGIMGGVNSMMGGFGYEMMNGYAGLGGNFFSIAIWAVISIDLILLGIFLWKKINK